MSDDTQKDAEALLQQSKEQKRHNAEPAQKQPEPEPEHEEVTLEDAVVDAYHDLDAGDLHENLTVRDENLAALIAGLEETGQLADVAERANQRLGRDEANDTRAGLLKALIRIGLNDVASDELTEAKSARTKYIQQKESESGF